MHSVTSDAVAKEYHKFHTTFIGVTANGWNIIDIQFDGVYKYPPIVSVTCKNYISIQSLNPTYWQSTLTPFISVTTSFVRICYYVRDSSAYTYDVNVMGELA